MNPEFLIVRDMTKNEFMDAVQEAKTLLSRISEDTVMMIAQNLGYCEESPSMAELGKVDVLSAVVELANQTERLREIAVKMQGSII